ncbi:protein ABHD18 [Tanacetum coccineum]
MRCYRATIEEARSLLHWLDYEEGYGKMGVCGLSMGGIHAAMVGSLHPTPVATFMFLSPHQLLWPSVKFPKTSYHYYPICFNMKTIEIDMIDNSDNDIEDVKGQR